MSEPENPEIEIASNAILKCLNTLADVEQLHEENIVFSLMTHTEFRKLCLLRDDGYDRKYIDEMTQEAQREAREIYALREPK